MTCVALTASALASSDIGKGREAGDKAASFAAETRLAQQLPDDPRPASLTSSALEILGSSGTVIGIGVSQSDGDVDFPLLKRKGIRFVYIKASQAAGIVNENAARSADAAHSAGLKVGLYHFFDVEAELGGQTRNFTRQLAAVYWDLPPFIDCVWVPRGTVREKYSPQVAQFASAIEVASGMRPLIYTRAQFSDKYLDRQLGQFPLFLADTSSAAPRASDLPKWWTDYEFWHVSVGVMDDAVLEGSDIFAFKGSEAALGALASRRGSAKE